MEGGGEASDGGAAITTGLEVDGSDAITVFIRCTDGRMFAIQVSLESSVTSFKSEIAKHCDIPAERQRLVYKGNLFKGDRSLKSYGLEAEHTVHLVPKPAASNNTTVEYGTIGAATLDLNELIESEEIQQGRNKIRRLSTEWMDQPLNDPDALRNTAMSSPQSREAINTNLQLGCIYNDPDISLQMAESAALSEIAERARGDGGSAGGGGGGGASSRHPARTDRSVPPVDLSRLGIADLERRLGCTIDPISVNQLMQNPVISQMIQRNLSDPQNMNPVLNPQYWERMQNQSLTRESIPHLTSPHTMQMLNSQYWERMQNQSLTRESIPHLTSPHTMQQMMALNQSLSSPPGLQPITRHVGETSGGTVGPEEVYASQLAQLQDMGFSDVRVNLEALAATAGNVEDAVARLV